MARKSKRPVPESYIRHRRLVAAKRRKQQRAAKRAAGREIDKQTKEQS